MTMNLEITVSQKWAKMVTELNKWQPLHVWLMTKKWNSEFEIEDDKELLPLYTVKQKKKV